MARSENLSRLADFLGLGPDGLELQAVEKFVGPYRADILAKTTETDEWVLIENQLARSDHSHLGQILVYAAGLDAKIVGWIAERFTAEHMAALDWLNARAEGVSIHAVEIELWRIGKSALAPRFNSVTQPNDWLRLVHDGRTKLEGLSPTRTLQKEYWAALESRIAERGGPLRPVAAQPQAWTQRGLGRTGAYLFGYMIVREATVRAEVYLTGPEAKTRFDALHLRRDEIDRAYGDELDWQRLDEKQDCRICETLHGADPTDRDDWARQHDWLIARMERLDGAFRLPLREC